VTIALNGIQFTQTGIYQSDGQSYDLAYQVGSDSQGWKGGDIFAYWLSSATPGPASCAGLLTESSYTEVNGNQAHVGDRYCYENWEGTLMVYMQVMDIDVNG